MEFDIVGLARNVLSEVHVGAPVSHLKYLSLMEKDFVGAYDADVALRKLGYGVKGDAIVRCE